MTLLSVVLHSIPQLPFINLSSNHIFVNLASRNKVKFMINFIGFWCTFEFIFPFSISALSRLSTTCQYSTSSACISSHLCRNLNSAREKLIIWMAPVFMSICDTTPWVNTHLISEVLQMVIVLAAGERCLIILFFYIPNSSRENPGANAAYCFPWDRRDGWFYSKYVSAQKLCSISSAKFIYLCCNLYLSVSSSLAYRVYFSCYLFACTS